MSTSTMFVMPVETHEAVVSAAFAKRGYTQEEVDALVKFCTMASWHGIRTHNAIKAHHIDDALGSKVGGCKPGAAIDKIPSRFKASEKWNSNRKPGHFVAAEAMKTAMALAEEYGVGVVSVDNATHYLWGGGYVMDAAKKGFIAFTCCTSAATEVVPFQGKFATLGTNPHSWGFPTTEQVGFPIVIDWATSAVAWGRVQQFAREGKELPPGIAVDEKGELTRDPHKVKALQPFGGHKGYGLSLINELFAAFTGGSLPTLRGLWKDQRPNEKHGSAFFFMAIHPEAMDVGLFAGKRSQSENVKRVLEDIRCHGNEHCLLPGQPEAEAARLSEKHGGLLFTEAEIKELEHIAEEGGVEFNRSTLKQVAV